MNNNKAVWALLILLAVMIVSVGAFGQVQTGGFTAASGSLYDFTLSTIFRIRASAGATASTTGGVAEDTTAAMYHNFTGGVDSQVGTWPTSQSITTGDCMAWAKTGSLVTLADTGFPCGNGQLSTLTNCTSSASPAVCGSAQAGTVTVAAAANNVVVDTTAVTANSEITLQYDSSLGTKLSVMCNTTAPVVQAVTARTSGVSFTITLPQAPITNPACFSYLIVN